MKKFMRISGKNLFFPIFLMNDGDVVLQDFDETEFIAELCKPHLEEYSFHVVVADVIESADPMVHPFGCEEEQAMAINSLNRLIEWPHVILKQGTAKEVQAIGSFNRLWDLCEQMGDIV